ncbi:MAG: Asp/Glu racemase [Myxococcota bacterium]
MEAEIPALLRAREAIRPERFTVHASRMRMTTVSAAELARMDAQSLRCAEELSDAAVDVQAYACLVAIMSQGPGAHRTSAARLGEVAHAPVLSSAGALVDALHHLGVKRVAMVCPYEKPLAKLVVDYCASEGITVVDHIALEIPDNLEVAAQDPEAPARLWRDLDVSGADAIIASACVQMPSLPAIPMIERESGLPTLSAAVATTWSVLRALDLEPVAPGGGSLLAPTQP